MENILSLEFAVKAVFHKQIYSDEMIKKIAAA